MSRSGAENTGVAFATIGVSTSTDFTSARLGTKTRNSLGWRHAYGERATQSSFHLAAATILPIGTALDKDSLVLDAGIDFAAAQASPIAANRVATASARRSKPILPSGSSCAGEQPLAGSGWSTRDV
ncbi:autotransporter domain-containing protein [Rhizobium tumorigenes]|uniref:autotransporter domain-containing protein n=1 Tax=Rhizobium tumorigenes TaxID=2041385 RepID=UPI00137B176A